MLGDSLLGNRQLGESEIGVRAPIYYTVTDSITKNDAYTIGVTLGQNHTINKTDIFSIALSALANATITKRERHSALVNGSPVSLLWRKIAKIVSTIWTKTPKP